MDLTYAEIHARNIVLDFYSRQPGIAMHPLRDGLGIGNLREALLGSGYNVAFSGDYGDAFKYMDGLISGDELLVSRGERMIALLRYRSGSSSGHRDSVKIEANSVKEIDYVCESLADLLDLS